MDKPYTILLVEDEIAHAELVQRAFELRDDPTRLAVVGTLAGARAHLAHESPPDLIIADWRLPDGEGVELLQAGYARLDAPVVIMTSHGNERVAVEAMKAGALDYVVKSETTLLDMPHVARRAIREWRNLTERARMEDVLRESEARFRLLAENSLDLISRHDPHGVCLYVSPACHTLLGYAPEELVGEPSYKTVHPDDYDQVVQAYTALLTQNAANTISFRVCRKDGRTIWLEATSRAVLDEQTGAVLEVQSALRDITQRKLAEEQIQRLNEDLTRRARSLAALNQAGQTVSSTLDLNSLLQRVVDQVSRLLDVEGASLLLRNIEVSENGKWKDTVCDDLTFAAATGIGSDKVVGMRVPSTSGIASWVLKEKRSVIVQDAQSDPRFCNAIDVSSGALTRSLLAVPLLFKGQTLGVLEAINKQNGSFDEHDVEVLEAICSSAAIAIENARLFSTELERAQALAQALEQQRELDRLQHEFIQNVSHELRTPLALIRGHAEVLENGWLGELPAEQKHSVSVIARRSQMLTKLVDDIVGILAVENRQLQREPVDLAHMIRQGLADFQSAVSQVGLSLEAEIAPDVPPVAGDALALRRALDNLVSNALKFTPAGGRVTVRLSRLEEAIKLEVADTGIGIPGNRLDRVFDRFYQVDGSTTRQYGGVGLGLALVKEIVAAHGGQITVTSQVGGGTTFTILLPLSVRAS